MTEQDRLGLSPRDSGRMGEVQRLALSGASGVAPLVALLSDSSWAVRRAVVAALARAGAPAVGPLCAVLLDERTNEAKLAAAVEALVASGADVETSVLALAERVDCAAPVLCDVAQILGRRRSWSGVPMLARWAVHPDDNVAVAAIEALGRIDTEAAVEPLLEAIRSRNFFRTFPAIGVLGQSRDPRVVEPLAGLLEEPPYAAEAAHALGRTGRLTAVAPLARLLADIHAGSVLTAASALLDLHARYTEGSGDGQAVIAAFRGEVPSECYVAAIAHVLPHAAAEQKVALATLLGWLRERRGVTLLLALLDEDSSVADRAFQAIRSLTHDAEPLVREAVRNGNSARRARLLPLLGVHRSVVGELILCLTDPEPSVRVLASDALGRIGDPSAVPALLDLIGDPAPQVAQSAIAAVQSLGSDEVKTGALSAARSGDPRTRRAAMRILSYFAYPEALDILLDAVTGHDERIRDVAASGLVLFDHPSAISALLGAVTHVSAGTRSAALRALGSGAPTAEIVAALRRGLHDENAWVRYYACQSLGKLRAIAASGDVAARIDDDAGQVRVAAIEAMAMLGGDLALASLEAASRAQDDDVRRAGLLGLGQLRRPEALPILTVAATSEDATTRLVALSAIASFRGPEAVAALIRAGTDPDPRVRAATFSLLAECGGRPATHWLIGQLSVPGERERALTSLATNVDGRVEEILTALESSDPGLSTSLVVALERMQRANAQVAIEAALHMDNVHARRAAATVLARLGSASARAALRAVAMLDPDPEVRRTCASVAG